jgi:DNA repair protein SbcD/Mre11
MRRALEATMQRPFRFLHAADFHLDAPCHCASALPDSLRDILIDAPLQAATKVFDLALTEHVDFVVLAGDLIDVQNCSPRELLFLADQFQRLAAGNIPIYWSGGTVDLVDQWPGYVSWPKNVHCFPTGRVERYRHEIGGAAICEIIGRSQGNQNLLPYEFAPSTAGLFSLAVAHADWNANALGEIGVNYWALGGEHQQSTPLDARCAAHYAGSHQGRCSGESGPHGATIVTVNEQGGVHRAPVACEVVRWIDLQLSLPATAERNELEQLLRQRCQQLQSDWPGVPLLATWHIDCSGQLCFALRHTSLASDLIQSLQQEFGNDASPIWTLSIKSELPDKLPDQWLVEQTMRGDFLRAVQRKSNELFPACDSIAELVSSHAQSVDEPLLVLDDVFATEDNPLMSAAGAPNRKEFLSIERDAAWLAAEVLGGAEVER